MKILILLFLVAPAMLILTSSQPEKQIAKNTEKQPASTVRFRDMTYCAPSFDPSKLDAADAPLFKGLGNLHYPITTNSAKAQQYFDQGLTLVYAFNHGEA